MCDMCEIAYKNSFQQRYYSVIFSNGEYCNIVSLQSHFKDITDKKIILTHLKYKDETENSKNSELLINKTGE